MTKVTRMAKTSESWVKQRPVNRSGLQDRRLHSNRTRKEDVVFEMNVLVKIALEFLQLLEERFVRSARIFGRLIVCTGFADLFD